MSKTHKKFHMGQFRCPRGYKRAKIANCRPGAIPPHSWDDIKRCKLSWRPWNVTRAMYKQNIIKSVAAKKLMKKFSLSFAEASKLIRWCYK